eukprot:COSAG01_NODE_3397_length_6144_cov_33.015550_2_plen_66_part_00
MFHISYLSAAVSLSLSLLEPDQSSAWIASVADTMDDGHGGHARTHARGGAAAAAAAAAAAEAASR